MPLQLRSIGGVADAYNQTTASAQNNVCPIGSLVAAETERQKYERGVMGSRSVIDYTKRDNRLYEGRDGSICLQEKPFGYVLGEQIARFSDAFSSFVTRLFHAASVIGQKIYEFTLLPTVNAKDIPPQDWKKAQQVFLNESRRIEQALGKTNIWPGGDMPFGIAPNPHILVFQKEKVSSISCDTTCALNGTNCKGKAYSKASITATHAHIGEIEAESYVHLSKTVCKGSVTAETYVMARACPELGPVIARDSVKLYGCHKVASVIAAKVDLDTSEVKGDVSALEDIDISHSKILGTLRVSSNSVTIQHSEIDTIMVRSPKKVPKIRDSYDYSCEGRILVKVAECRPKRDQMVSRDGCLYFTTSKTKAFIGSSDFDEDPDSSGFRQGFVFIGRTQDPDKTFINGFSVRELQEATYKKYPEQTVDLRNGCKVKRVIFEGGHGRVYLSDSTSHVTVSVTGGDVLEYDKRRDL